MRFQVSRTVRVVEPILIAVLLLTDSTIVWGSDLFTIANVRVFDGRLTIPDANVSVAQGKIVSIETERGTTPSAEPTIDAGGMTLIPGLINAHVHVIDTLDTTSTERLEASVRAGVLSVIDLHGDAGLKSRLRALRGTIGLADVFATGPGATAPGGHGTQFGHDPPTLETPQEARGFVRARIAEGSEYLKITITDREGPRNRLNNETILALARAAQAESLLSVAHISRQRDALYAIEVGIDGLAHIWYQEKEAISEADLATLTRHPFFMSPTLLVVQRYIESNPDRSSFEVLLEEVRRLHEAGVVLLAGTDPPSFGINYGTDLHTELALLVRAGLNPEEALSAATRNIADAYGLEDRGAIEVGRRADLVLIDGDPTRDISDIGRIARVWQSGVEIAESALRK